MYFLKELVTNNTNENKKTLYSKEGTKLTYKKLTDKNGKQETYVLKEGSLEDYCYNIYNCLDDSRLNYNQGLIENKKEEYEEESEKYKLQISPQEHKEMATEYHNKDFNRMNKLFEKSLDGCLDKQENLLLTISHPRSSVMEINKHLPVFPSYVDGKMYKSNHIIKIKKYD